MPKLPRATPGQLAQWQGAVRSIPFRSLRTLADSPTSDYDTASLSGDCRFDPCVGQFLVFAGRMVNNQGQGKDS